MHKRRAIPAPTEVQPLLLTVEQVAAILGVHRSTVYTLIEKEGLPAVSLGRRRGTRVRTASLHRWIQERETAPHI